jgi:hypothetical protein
MKQSKWKTIIVIYIFGHIHKICQMQTTNDSSLIFDFKLIVLEELCNKIANIKEINAPSSWDKS